MADKDDELPWNEEKWERFLQESEARSARYSELFETLLDHPDRDELIEHEMGWDKPVERDDIDPQELAELNEMKEDLQNALNDPNPPEFDMDEDEAELEAMPAYNRATAFASKVHDAVKEHVESKDEDVGEDAGQAFINSHIVAAKLAGAHGMGYEDDVLCGNICVCKRSLAAAGECLAALERLRAHGIMPPEVVNRLIEEGKEIKALVDEHINELRGRVWWE